MFQAGDVIKLKTSSWSAPSEDRFMLVIGIFDEAAVSALSLYARSERTDWIPVCIKADGVEGSKSGLPCDYMVPGINPLGIKNDWIEARVGSVSLTLVNKALDEIRKNQ